MEVIIATPDCNNYFFARTIRKSYLKSAKILRQLQNDVEQLKLSESSICKTSLRKMIFGNSTDKLAVYFTEQKKARKTVCFQT